MKFVLVFPSPDRTFQFLMEPFIVIFQIFQHKQHTNGPSLKPTEPL
jgi:hypothetical protein